MPMSLEKWQERLERHFESLAGKRAISNFPIFAFEHGLNDEELEEVSSLLRSRLAARFPLAPHWLLWVIYATELGYGYDGDEYWRSFEEKTPNWDFSDRYKIPTWFTKFQKTYHGVAPSGPWAKHFRIIAWPITHAILPRYLQRQFAQTLFDLRYQLAGMQTLEPAAIGRMLALNAHHASTRFEKFLQQEELTGRIVMALLDETSTEGEELIDPHTLMRIVVDLERVRNARELLKETQRFVADRFKGIGSGSGHSGQHSYPHHDSRATDGNEHPDIRASLLLRYAGAGTWSVVLEVPSFRSVAALNADIRNFLRGTRCKLNGANDTKPSGWLLAGNRKGVLKSWPDSQKPLIEFEESHSTVDHLVDSECRLSAGPVWLFRIGRDGTAREISGRIVRPGHDYIVLTINKLPENHACMSPCSVDCSDIKSFRIKVLTELSVEDTKWLNELDLQVARTIRVWPAGLPGRGWDGEGNSEWLTTETPCFGIVHDHPLDAYVLNLNNGAKTVIEAGRVGSPLFVRLPPLPAGKHTLSVQARRSTSLGTLVTSPPAEGFVDLRVREPEPWIPGTSSHAGLIVTLDPHDANLDTFWESDVSLSVLGPENHQITCTVSLERGDGDEIFSEPVGTPIDLPLTPGAWNRRFSKFVDREDCAWRYLEASSGRLVIRGEELGEYVVRFERNVLPVRWVLRRDHGRIVLRLIDDTGREDSEPTILFFDMLRPAKAVAYSPGDVFSGSIVDLPGGLFVAKHGEHRDAIVVSAGLLGQGLQALGVDSDFCDVQDSEFPLANSLRALAIWSEARLAGFLPDIRRRLIMDGFISAIYEKLCGIDWRNAEAAFIANPKSQRVTQILQSAVDKHRSFAAVLRHDFEKMNDDAVCGSQWFSGVARRYGVCTDSKLCTFSLRLASEPQRLPHLYGDRLEDLLGRMGENRTLLRGARFLALLCANQNVRGTAALIPGWKW